MRIFDGSKFSLDDWTSGDRDPIDYFVIDDQYNDERYVYVEVVRPAAFTEAWLRDLMRTLARQPGWGAGLVSFRKGYVLVFADRIIVTGKPFAKCRDLTDVVRQGRAEMEKG